MPPTIRDAPLAPRTLRFQAGPTSRPDGLSTIVIDSGSDRHGRFTSIHSSGSAICTCLSLILAHRYQSYYPVASETARSALFDDRP